MENKESMSYEEALKILSVAEVRVLELLERGYTSSEIADKLVIPSEPFRRTNRTSAIKSVFRAGLGCKSGSGRSGKLNRSDRR